MIDKNNIPTHVAIIMDGNGRWAKERGLPRTAGHREGIKRVREIVNLAAELGVKIVTFFAFSTENWDRPKNEIDMLMIFLGDYLTKEVHELHKNNIKFRVIGRAKPLTDNVIAKIKAAEDKTRDNTGLTMVLALNYGARQEVLDAVKKITQRALCGEINIDELDEKGFADYLYTRGLTDPDLLIRTSGQMRLSNFLLWQLSYAELYFSKKYWPDFLSADFQEAILEYQKRERRFGGLSEAKVRC